MLASLLYHTNQITEIQVKNVEYFPSKIVFHVIHEPKKPLCPCCGYLEHTSKGKKIRKLRLAPLGDKPSSLSLEVNRLKCVNCSHVWWPPIGFVRGKKRVTLSFERYVIALMRFATIEHTAQFLGVSWGLVKDIHKAYLRREYKPPDYKALQYIGVDEFSIRKGHNYMTTFTNLATGEILHAVEGKSIECVRPFLELLATEAPDIKAIAMDMNAAYASAVKQYLVKIDVVFDRFHIVALLNMALEEIRRSQQNKCNEIGLRVIKGCRFLLLKNYEKLDPRKQSSLQCLLEVNQPLATAHAMKEQIRLLWTKSDLKEGTKFLAWWIMDAIETGVKELQKAGRTLLRCWEGVTNYFKHRITNAMTEGINNKIKTMKRQAYGFRDMEYFKLRLYSLHKTRYSFS